MDFNLSTYYPIFLYLVVIIGFAISAVAVAHFVAPKKKTPVKQMPYESGMDPIGDARGRFTVRFYMVAMLFILFDIEVIFLYPIAVQLRAYGSYALAETVTFIVLLVVAFVYVWRRGARECR